MQKETRQSETSIPKKQKIRPFGIRLATIVGIVLGRCEFINYGRRLDSTSLCVTCGGSFLAFLLVFPLKQTYGHGMRWFTSFGQLFSVIKNGYWSKLSQCEGPIDCTTYQFYILRLTFTVYKSYF